MALTRSDVSGFIINPLSSFHVLLFVSVVSYFIRLMLTPQLTVVSHTLALASLSSFWLGCIIIVSFMEAWVKFLAPTLSGSAGVDVGRHVFSCLNKVEICISITLLHLLEMQWTTPALQLPYKVADLESLNLSLLTPIVLVGFLQTCWLLPALLHRSQSLIASAAIPTSISRNSDSYRDAEPREGSRPNEEMRSRGSSDNPYRNASGSSNSINGLRNPDSRSISHLLYVSTEVVKVSCISYAIFLLTCALMAYVEAVARE
ncbi:hypothetical protein DSO57_1027264 [Entomophthora muscae]|uniref:Uncharacterized protein n=1 Tax=Entomophthora muscae TaxID=34485 RepID=A0ACC2U1B4_9FUNG|nr:hypothetical protein DSO57_1027264 [Entomophthora muscae]